MPHNNTLRQKVLHALEESSEQDLHLIEKDLDLILPYLEEVPELEATIGATEAKTIEVKLSEAGDTVVTTRKPLNLRFNLKELAKSTPDILLDGAKTVGFVADDALLLACAATLRFFMRMKDLINVKLSGVEGKILIELYRHQSDENVKEVEKDPFLTDMHSKFNEADVATALDHLDQLQCIRLLDDRIMLNEKIVFKSK
jgi:hypothetical protein